LEVPSTANFNTSYEGKNIGRITNTELVYNQTLNRYFDITSGAGFKYSNTSQFSHYSSPGYDPGPSISNADTTHSSITSVFTSVFFKSNIFHMELGGRYNYHSKYGSNFTYTINPSVIIAHDFKLFATIASAFKAPSLYQLYSQYGNINLKPETTTSYEAGFDWQIINDLAFNTVFYKRKTTDVIYFYTTPNFSRSYYLNGNLEDDKGFESELKYHTAGLTASAYAAYVTGTQTDTKGVDTHNLLRRPRNTYGASLAYDVTKAFSFSLNYKYTGERSDTHFLNVAPYSRVEGLAPYSLVDLHLQAQATKKLTLFVDLNNLFNAKYIDWIGYNTRGFNAYGGLKYLIN
jgi:vitamin B12 transporter